MLDAASRAAFTPWPSLAPCAGCGHPQGDHASTAGTGFNVHPVRHGHCRVTGCDCPRWLPIQ
jgi:hypothetical protein